MGYDIKYKILLVEDDNDSIKIFQRMLNEYQLDFCESEISLYNKLSENNYDLILMDIGLAGSKDGIQLIDQLKKDKKYSSIPIVCITSRAYPAQETLAMNAGADAYVTKPVNKTKLISIINRILDC